MTGKIKRRSLRCGGRPKADFGSIFTTFIAPALGVAGSVADSAISKTQVSKSNTKPAVKDTNTEVTNNNTSVENLPTIQVPTKEPISGLVTSNTVIPPDPTKTPAMRLGGRKKCWIGAAIMGATSIAGSLFGGAAQKREMRRQKNIQDWQNTTQEAANMTTALNNSQDYQEDYLRQFRTAARLGKTLGAKGIYITDGGDATKIGSNTYLLRGGSHEDVNETGQTGIGINVGGNEVEAEGGEVAQKKNGALRIFSAQPILGNGMSPAQAILRGYNKDAVFSQQQAFKKRNGLKDDGSKAKHSIEVPYKRIHINEDGTFTDILTGKNYNTSATNGEDIVITGKANHWKEAGKKNTSSYFDPMGAVNFATAAGAPILNANPSNVVGSIRDSKNFKDFVRHYMMQDTGGFVNTKWAKEHPYLSLGINTVGDIGLGVGANKAVDILRNPMNYGKYGYKLNKLYKKAGLLKRGDYKTIQENYEKNYIYDSGQLPYDYLAHHYNESYPIAIRNKILDKDKHYFNDWVYKNREEKNRFKRIYRKKATDNAFTEMHTPIRYGFNKGVIADYDDLMNHNPEYYKFLEETNLPWNEQSTVDAFLKRQKTSLRGRSDVRSKVYSKYPSLRHKAAIGMYIPFNKRYTSIYDAPDYDYDYNGGNVLGNNEVTVTAKRIKPTFMKPNNDAMNLIKVPKEEVPYIPQHHNRSRTIFSGGDYLGLGIDTLAALSTGLVNYNTAGKYTLPDRAPIIQASKLPTTYNVNPEIEEVKRYRDRLTGQTFNNTSSSVAALNRSGAINLDALSNLSKLWATKENEENKMLTEDAKNQQTVAAQNVQNELARQSEIARIKNEATQAKGDALNVGLSGLSQAWTNFWTAGRTAYEDDQSRRAMIASSKEATPTRLSEMDFGLSPDILASLYRTAKDDRTKRFYLSRLSPKQRLKYGIN